MDEKTEVIVDVCKALSAEDSDGAAAILNGRYPFEAITKVAPNLTKERSIKIFERDGYRDRYTGQRLIFPGSMLLISKLLPEAFPTHPNWKTEHTHFAYYELWPVIDHVTPLTRKGTNDENNLVTTSAIRNMAKSNFALKDLGWTLLDVPVAKDWDGLAGWFREQISLRTDLITENDLLAKWTVAFERAASAAV